MSDDRSGRKLRRIGAKKVDDSRKIVAAAADEKDLAQQRRPPVFNPSLAALLSERAAARALRKAADHEQRVIAEHAKKTEPLVKCEVRAHPSKLFFPSPHNRQMRNRLNLHVAAYVGPPVDRGGGGAQKGSATKDDIVDSILAQNLMRSSSDDSDDDQEGTGKKKGKDQQQQQQQHRRFPLIALFKWKNTTPQRYLVKPRYSAFLLNDGGESSSGSGSSSSTSSSSSGGRRAIRIGSAPIDVTFKGVVSPPDEEGEGGSGKKNKGLRDRFQADVKIFCPFVAIDGNIPLNVKHRSIADDLINLVKEAQQLQQQQQRSSSPVHQQEQQQHNIPSINSNSSPLSGFRHVGGSNTDSGSSRNYKPFYESLPPEATVHKTVVLDVDFFCEEAQVPPESGLYVASDAFVLAEHDEENHREGVVGGLTTEDSVDRAPEDASTWTAALNDKASATRRNQQQHTPATTNSSRGRTPVLGIDGVDDDDNAEKNDEQKKKRCAQNTTTTTLPAALAESRKKRKEEEKSLDIDLRTRVAQLEEASSEVDKLRRELRMAQASNRERKSQLATLDKTAEDIRAKLLKYKADLDAGRELVDQARIPMWFIILVNLAAFLITIYLRPPKGPGEVTLWEAILSSGVQFPF